MLYVDTDLLLALVKPRDRLKDKAAVFMRSHSATDLVTSSISLLEIWFHYYKNNLPFVDESLHSMRSLVGDVWPVTADILHAAIPFSKSAGLSPADAVHAYFAKNTDGIVSTDAAFRRVPGLRHYDFTQ